MFLLIIIQPTYTILEDNMTDVTRQSGLQMCQIPLKV
jgi:hypothetical protein